MVRAIPIDHSRTPSEIPSPVTSKPSNRDELLDHTSRIIVAGSRDWEDLAVFRRVLTQYLTEVHKGCHVAFISGMAKRGADAFIWKWCRTTPFNCYEYPAQWDVLGKRAGYVRNDEMAQDATHLLVFWDERSRGSLDMIKRAIHYGLIVHVCTITYGLNQIQTLDQLNQ